MFSSVFQKSGTSRMQQIQNKDNAKSLEGIEWSYKKRNGAIRRPRIPLISKWIQSPWTDIGHFHSFLRFEPFTDSGGIIAFCECATRFTE